MYLYQTLKAFGSTKIQKTNKNTFCKNLRLLNASVVILHDMNKNLHIYI